ncbi:tetratricopeptide repeat protein [Desulfobacula phenolica]|uniref:Two-component response regulator, PleD family, consists of two REC domains and a diguanylate cyclase (GGDEF) domain n=1 Tax=Desulfobacula phenolica TaxID=90732 RepID=A0A1H2GAP9_9BACT|nr:tetratricopeptide repeat protein [Desulfobacula phenolica]SDU16707.1 Two-component response regulator, PleD family, consists of two REC domains and a diguanylate cyclase (GGDEF) domain [Desulfobacula phenolica]
MEENKQILLVDDDKHKLQQLDTMMKTVGFNHLLLADDGDTAWGILKDRKIDCVIAAYEMKEISGLALLKIIRRDDSLFDTPFFLADNAFTKIKVIKAGQTGVTGLFVTPYDEKVIHRKIPSALKKLKAPVIRKTENTVNQGIRLIEKKEYGKAIEVFTSVIKKKEIAPEIYFNIGYCKTLQGKHTEAIEAFSMATRLDKLFAKAYEEMGRVYKLMGNFAKAEECMHQAAEIYMDSDKIGAAEDVLNEILESGTNSLNIFNTLGVLYRKKGDPQTALNQYKKALKVHPDEPYIYYNIGRLYLDMKDISAAKKKFQQALEKDPGFQEAKQVIKAIDLGMV